MLPAIGTVPICVPLISNVTDHWNSSIGLAKASSSRCLLIHPNRSENHYSFMVYIGSMPLRAPPGIGQWAVSSVDHILRSTQLQHFYTILESSAGSVGNYRVFDFQPQNPEDSYTALIALSGGVVPGVVMERKISRLPSKRCWKVGPSRSCISIEDAIDFNRKWDTQLQLWKHDCRHHTNEFVEFLTGKKAILDNMMRDRQELSAWMTTS